MHLRGEVKFKYENLDLAGDIAMLIQLDNEIAPKTLRINTRAVGADVVTVVESYKTSSFFATIDDLIFSEKLIANIIELET